MRNKKNIWSVLAIVLVVACIAPLCLVGCGPKTDPNASDFTTIKEAIIKGYEKSVGSGDEATLDFRQVNFASKASVALTEGTTTSTYDIDLAAKLDLRKTTEKNTAVRLVIKENNKILFGFWYDNSLTERESNAYVQYYNSTTESDVKKTVKAVDVNKVLQEQVVNFKNASDAKIESLNEQIAETESAISVETDSTTKKELTAQLKELKKQLAEEKEYNAQLANNIFPDSANDAMLEGFDLIAGYLNFAGLAVDEKSCLYKENDFASFSMPLTSLLTPGTELGNLISENADTFGAYIKLLQLDLDLTKLAQVLPAINVDFKFNFTADGSIKDNSITAGINQKAEGLVIKHYNADSKFLDIALPNDLSAKVAFDLAVNDATKLGTFYPTITEFDENNKIGALNAQLAGEINLTHTDGVSGLKVGPLTVTIPKGDYELKLDIDADPTVLIGKEFTTGGKFDASKAIPSILDAINYLDLKITNKDTGEDLLGVAIFKNSATGTARVNADLGALGMGSLTNSSKKGLSDLIIGFIPSPSTEETQATASVVATADEEDEEEVNKTTATLTKIGNILKLIGIKVDNSGLGIIFKGGIDAGHDVVVNVDVTATLGSDGIDVNFDVENNLKEEDGSSKDGYFHVAGSVSGVTFSYGTSPIYKQA